MTLREDMADDWDDLLDDFGQAVTVTPALYATTFSVTGVFGDQTQAYQPQSNHVEKATSAEFNCQRSAWSAALLAAHPAATTLIPQRGDKLVVTGDDPYAGTWYVLTAAEDVGDGLVIQVRRDEIHQLGAEGFAQVMG